MKYLNTRSEIFTNIVSSLSIIGEIGVFKGDFSKIIYDLSKPKELHLIDLFDGNMMSGDKDGLNIISTNLNYKYDLLKQYFKFNNNVFYIKAKV